MDDLWWALLLSDSAFPGGSLANSHGLESALKHGAVRRDDPDCASLLRYIDMSLEQAVCQSLPFVRTSRSVLDSSTCEGVPGHTSVQTKIALLDEYCHALLSNAVSRRSSINQGKCFLRVMTESFPSMEAPLQHLMMLCLPSAACTLHQTVKDLGSEEPASMPLVLGHFPVVFGVVCGLLHVSKDLVDRIFLKMFTRDLVSAAVRLGILGPIEGVRVQARSFEQLERLLRTDLKQLSIEGNDRSDASSEDWSDGCIHFYKNIRPTQTAPTIDLLQSRHDQLYSRLFNS